MHEGIIAMLGIIAILVIRDMAKTILSDRREKNLSEIYENHPQKEQMEKYAGSFQKLANTFYDMPFRKEHLTAADTDEIFENLKKGVCARCARKESCWNLCGHLTYQQGCELLDALEEGNQEQIVKAFGEWTEHCISGARFLEEMRQQFFRARQDLLWNNRMIENRLAVAEQLNEVARIMQRTAEEIYSVSGVPAQLEGQARKLLGKLHVVVKKMWTLEQPEGRQKIYVTMRVRGGQCVTVGEVARRLSDLYKVRLVAARENRSVLNSEYTTVLFTEDTNYRVLYSAAKITKEKETVSGDSYTCCDEDGHLVMCLSDGMGSGIAASRESEAVVELLEEFITSGFSKETAARMINSALVLQRSDGMFSTVDICSLDLYTGMCGFLKAGAAATFIRRDQWVETISSTSMAAGLVQQMDFDTSVRKLYDGEYLVMVTDGVLDALPLSREEETMKDILLDIHCSTPREFGRAVLEKVMSYGGYRARDDMTVLVAGIWKKA